MTEAPFAFEDAEAGILTLPPSGTAHRDVGVVWLNAGAIRRAGPFRLHVHAARRFAAQGFPTLRVDQPGVGDHLSTARRPQLAIAEDMLERFAQATGCRRFIVGGICSAADFGWQWALRDPRIHGLMLMDPVARRSAPGFRLGQFQLLVSRGPSGWAEFLGKRLAPSMGGARVTDDQLREWPPEGQEAGELDRLVDRGVSCFVLYTGGAATYFTHPRQFFHGFGPSARHPSVRFGYWRDTDHLFFRPDDRERLLDALCHWLGDRFAPPT